jgi:hypothetical protein
MSDSAGIMIAIYIGGIITGLLLSLWIAHNFPMC